jgi:hypothetical protein
MTRIQGRVRVTPDSNLPQALQLRRTENERWLVSRPSIAHLHEQCHLGRIAACCGDCGREVSVRQLGNEVDVPPDIVCVDVDWRAALATKFLSRLEDELQLNRMSKASEQSDQRFQGNKSVKKATLARPENCQLYTGDQRKIVYFPPQTHYTERVS